MIKKSKATLFVVMIAILALAAVGCGSQAGLQHIKDSGEFAVAGSGGYPPFNFIADDSDDIIGFDVDTGKAIAEQLGVELNYIATAWDGIIEGVRANRYDAVLGSMAITEDRKKEVNFTIPYYYSGAQLVVRKDSGITDPSQMDGKKIGIATGTTFTDDAEALGAEVVNYEDDTQTLMELLNGRIDGVITDRLVAIDAIQTMEGGDQLEMAGDLLRLEEMALAINKDHEDLLEELNNILEQLHEDGTLSQISKDWFDGMDITVK